MARWRVHVASMGWRVACMGAVVVGVVSYVLPVSAMAGGCEVLRDARDRAECVARQSAREEARAEVERQLGSRGGGEAGRTAAWQDAVDEANGIDLGALLEPRPIAAVGGLAWFAYLVRSRRRARSRARRS